MANRFYNFVDRFLRGTRVSSDAVNAQFDAVEDGFDRLPQGIESFADGRQIFAESVTHVGNAYSATTGDSRPAPLPGDRVVFVIPAGARNTGAATLSVDGSTPTQLIRANGGQLVPGDLSPGLANMAVYNPGGVGYGGVPPRWQLMAHAEAGRIVPTTGSVDKAHLTSALQRSIDDIVPVGAFSIVDRLLNVISLGGTNRNLTIPASTVKKDGTSVGFDNFIDEFDFRGAGVKVTRNAREVQVEIDGVDEDAVHDISQLEAFENAMRTSATLANNVTITPTAGHTAYAIPGNPVVPDASGDRELVFLVNAVGIDPASATIKLAALRALPTVEVGGTLVEGTNVIRFTNQGGARNDDNVYLIGWNAAGQFVFGADSATANGDNYILQIIDDRINATPFVTFPDAPEVMTGELDALSAIPSPADHDVGDIINYQGTLLELRESTEDPNILHGTIGTPTGTPAGFVRLELPDPDQLAQIQWRSPTAVSGVGNVSVRLEKSVLGASPPATLYARIVAQSRYTEDVVLDRLASNDTATLYAYRSRAGDSFADATAGQTATISFFTSEAFTAGTEFNVLEDDRWETLDTKQAYSPLNYAGLPQRLLDRIGNVYLDTNRLITAMTTSSVWTVNNVIAEALPGRVYAANQYMRLTGATRTAGQDGDRVYRVSPSDTDGVYYDAVLRWVPRHIPTIAGLVDGTAVDLTNTRNRITLTRTGDEGPTEAYAYLARDASNNWFAAYSEAGTHRFFINALTHNLPEAGASPIARELEDTTVGITITDTTRSFQQALTGFSVNSLTITDTEHGVLIIGATPRVAVGSTSQLALGAISDVREEVFLSDLRSGNAYLGSSSALEGQIISRVEIDNTSGDLLGWVRLRLARTSANAVGWYMDYEMTGSAASTTGSIQFDLEISFFPTDAPDETTGASIRDKLAALMGNDRLSAENLTGLAEYARLNFNALNRRVQIASLMGGATTDAERFSYDDLKDKPTISGAATPTAIASQAAFDALSPANGDLILPSVDVVHSVTTVTGGFAVMAAAVNPDRATQVGAFPTRTGGSGAFGTITPADNRIRRIISWSSTDSTPPLRDLTTIEFAAGTVPTAVSMTITPILAGGALGTPVSGAGTRLTSTGLTQHWSIAGLDGTYFQDGSSYRIDITLNAIMPIWPTMSMVTRTTLYMGFIYEWMGADWSRFGYQPMREEILDYTALNIAGTNAEGAVFTTIDAAFNTAIRSWTDRAEIGDYLLVFMRNTTHNRLGAAVIYWDGSDTPAGAFTMNSGGAEGTGLQTNDVKLDIRAPGAANPALSVFNNGLAANAYWLEFKVLGVRF